MKKILSILTGLCACVMLAQAEEMNFITTLSAPVGTFMTLETANSAAAVHAPTTNFGTTKMTSGNIDIMSPSSQTPLLGTVTAQRNNMTISGSNSILSTKSIDIGTGVTIKGKVLKASSIRLKDSSQKSPKITATTIYNNYVTTARGAIIENLDFGNSVSISKSGAAQTGATLYWSNFIQQDCTGTGPTCGGDFKNQYLLKTDSGESTAVCTGPKGSSWGSTSGGKCYYQGREVHGSVRCNWNSSTCKYQKVASCYVPYIDDDETTEESGTYTFNYNGNIGSNNCWGYVSSSYAGGHGQSIPSACIGKTEGQHTDRGIYMASYARCPAQTSGEYHPLVYTCEINCPSTYYGGGPTVSWKLTQYRCYADPVDASAVSGDCN